MIAILGGGITGLTAAYKLQQENRDFILLEASAEVGGKIKSIQEGGFTFELGPNTVLINNEETKWLLSDLNLMSSIIQPDPIAIKNRFVLKNNSIEAIPNSFRTLLSSKLIGFKTLVSIFKEPFLSKKTIKNESLASFSQRRFGNQIYEDLITPFVTGIYAGDPEKMSVDYTLQILKKAEQEHGSVLRGMLKIMKEKKVENEEKQLPKQKIFTFERGLAQLIKVLFLKLEKKIHLTSTVNTIKKVDGGYQIEYTRNGQLETIIAEKVISTIPAPQLSTVLKQWQSSLSHSLEQIQYVPAVITHLAYKKNEVGFQKAAFGILSRKKEDVPFLGVLFNSRFFPHSAPKGFELITVISGGYKQGRIIEEKDEQIVQQIHQSLSSILTISALPVYTHVHRWKTAIPQYELNYGEIEEQIKQLMQVEKNFIISGNFYEGISVSDCIKNGIRAVERLQHQ